MTDLSPAAHTVWHAYETADCDPYLIDPRQAGVAAALRAAADQMGSYQSKKFLYSIADAMKLRNIADELDNTSQPSK
jgi:hypothetical protein